MIEITLPYPPSANRLWRKAQGKIHRSDDYKKWSDAARTLCRIALRHAPAVHGPYILTILAERPDKRLRDLDNLIKPCSDALAHSGVVRDDSDAEEIHVYWSGAGHNIIVKVEPA